MIIICNGIVRSGSTWSYNVCRSMAQLISKHFPQPPASGYLSEAQLDQFLSMQKTPNTPLTVVKAHEVGPVALEWIRTHRAIAVCTLRDPRDCVTSDLAFMKHSMAEAIERVRVTLKGVSFFEDFGRTLFIRYEDMMADRLAQIKRIAIHMGITMDQQTVVAVDSATNMEASKKVCDDLKNRRPDQVQHICNHLVDQASQLHDNHINGGKVGKWKDELPVEQAEHLTKIFEPWLLKLGYETEQSIRSIGIEPAAAQQMWA